MNFISLGVLPGQGACRICICWCRNLTVQTTSHQMPADLKAEQTSKPHWEINSLAHVRVHACVRVCERESVLTSSWVGKYQNHLFTVGANGTWGGKSLDKVRLRVGAAVSLPALTGCSWCLLEKRVSQQLVQASTNAGQEQKPP